MKGEIKVAELIYADESYKIIGACFNVYKEMGCGFLESVYHECLELELAYQNISYVSQQEVKLSYRGKKLSKTFIPDFICFEKIIVELKAVSKLADEHRAQVLNYLNATEYKLGLLVNFGHFPKLEYQRIVL
jgi:GxxExxY protein